MIRIVGSSAGKTVERSVSAGVHFDWTCRPRGWETFEDKRALDLLDIVVAAHLADRAVRRNLRLGLRTRRIEMTLRLRLPDLWTSVKAELEELAAFASRDEWSLSFEALKGERSARIAPTESRDKDEEKSSVVALFSGGLDSLAGAALMAEGYEKPIFVTHSPPGRRATFELITELWKKMTGENFRSEHCYTFWLRPRTRDNEGHRTEFNDATRRTRPFFFLGLAAAVAIEKRIPRVWMSENGAMAVSLPMRCDAYDAQRARQAHEFLIDGFQKLLIRIAGDVGAWEVSNPLRDKTKGEACRSLGKVPDLVRRTRTCEYIGRQKATLIHWSRNNEQLAKKLRLGDGPQCGLCEPCIARRAALAKAGIEDPDKDYFFDARSVAQRAPGDVAIDINGRVDGVKVPLYGSTAPHVFYFRRFCERLLGLSPLGLAIGYLPELRLPCRAGAWESENLAQRYSLLQRFSREVLDFLADKPRQNMMECDFGGE